MFLNDHALVLAGKNNFTQNPGIWLMITM